jgi:predicted ATPase/serine/threonine protein kinase
VRGASSSSGSPAEGTVAADPASERLLPGQTVEHYRIVGKIGAGGMGEVFLATDLKLNRPVALKTLPPWLAQDREARTRLLHEARLASSISHPCIVTIHSIESLDDLDFIVMEFVEGQTLISILREGPLPIPLLLDIGIQAAEALGVAHDTGLIHRDVKSANLVLTPRGQVKILDFGLAKWVVARDQRPMETLSQPSTAADVIKGTVPYMSPEQARGEPLDGRTDLFSLGCVLYECATGRRPFRGENTLAILHRITTAEPDPPSAFRSDLPAGFDAVLSRVLSKDRSLRFATGREFADALRPLRDAGPGRSGAVPVGRPAPSARHNLAASLTSFIGRDKEREEIRSLLHSHRLVTLTGAGGCGKSRLALQVAFDALPDYPDGAWRAELAPLSDPGLVCQAVTAALGIREEPSRAIADTLTDALRSKSVLLLLDNCEHLVEACGDLTLRLLPNCPGVRILTTSRSALSVPGERLWHIPTLAIPEDAELASGTVETWGQYDAIRLFEDRAVAARENFRLTDRNGALIAQICRRLDGIPLAIELAAARVAALSLEGILSRLEDRFRLLTGGARAELPRQQTLRAAVDWSYDLLTEPERDLFARTSVFSGSFSLEAAEAICTDEEIPPEEVFDLISNLVGKSLLAPLESGGDAARYRLLETLRAYGLERLRAAGRHEAFRDRHASYFLEVAREAEPNLQGPEQAAWLNRLDAEHDNLRLAIQSLADSGSAEDSMILCGLLWRFWWVRGTWSEGRKRLDQAVQAGRSSPPGAERVKALHGAAVLARGQGSYDAAEAYLKEGLALARALGDSRGVALTLHEQGNIANEHADLARARSLYEESLAVWRGLGDQRGMSSALHNLGVVAQAQADFEAAGKLYGESLAIQRALGNRAWEAASLNGLGGIALAKGDLEAARRFNEEALGIQNDLGDKWGMAFSLRELGGVAERRGDHPSARELLLRSMAALHELGDREGTAEILERLAGVALALRRPERVHRLAGAAAALREAIGSPLTPSDEEALGRHLSEAEGMVGAEASARAYSEGRHLTLEQAERYAAEEGN